MTTTNGNRKIIILLAFAAVYIIWGSTYFAILIGLKDIPPFLLSGLRFLVAGILLFGWCLFKKERMPNGRSTLTNSICGICMLVGGTASVAWAEQYLPSSIAAIIVTIVPFWFVLLDRQQWSFYFSNKLIIVGLLMGFAGVALLVSFESPIQEHSTGNFAGQLTGALAILGGGIAWTVGSLYSKYRPTGNSLLMNGTLQLLAAGSFCLLLSALTGEWTTLQLHTIQGSSWLALLYLVTMGSLVAYMAYLFLLDQKPAAQVSTYVYVNPIVALLLGVWLAHETITAIKVIALLIVLLGVLLVNLPKYNLRWKTK